MKQKRTENRPLTLAKFKEMDILAVEKYNLPIELMMENAGLQLARKVADHASADDNIVIGAGNGNNGGGGLVAARRLAGWGYSVYLDLPVDITKDLPQKQLQRAMAFEVNNKLPDQPNIWVDAYLGFSQKLPLSPAFAKSVHQANRSGAFRISLDLPTGLSSKETKEEELQMFNADVVLTLAAFKKILNHLPESKMIYIADIGLPKAVYTTFGLIQPAFNKHQIIPIK